MALVSKTFSQIITFTRASTATYFDATGTLQSAAIDAPRLDYNPATLAAQGFLVEEARTNSIRNNTMQGAVAGTPGTLPTNWSRSASPTSGISNEIVGTGTESGVTYIDLRFSGTATATFSFNINLETTTQVSASPSQTWTVSTYVKLTAGVLNGATISFTVGEYSSVPAFLRNNFSSATTPTSAGLATQRAAYSLTTGASTASIQPQISVNFINGQIYDITLRIGLPQLEQGAFATSVIPTTTTALTRSADVASVNTLSPWYNATEGTLYAEAQTIALPITNAHSVGSLEDAVGTERIQIRATASPLGWNGIVVDGVSQATLNSNVVLTTAKMALAYAVNNFKFCVNGAAPITDTLGTLPTPTALQLGRSVSTLNLNGWLCRLTYYPRALSAAELQTITA